MTTLTPASGTDTWIDDAHPNRVRSGGNKIRLQAAHAKGGIHIPLTNIRGRTVLSAVLIGHVKAGFTGQTVTVHLPIEAWKTAGLTWNNQPATGTSVATVLSGTFNDGDAVELDFLTIAQAVASGAAIWRGLILTTNAGTAGNSDWYAFDSGLPAWSLEVEVSDTPDPPTDLQPNGDYIGSTAPVVDWQPFDLSGDAFSQGAFQVQADPAADEISPDFDSGWVTSTAPELDLSTTAFTPLTTGGVLRFRVRIRDAAGTTTTDWSDWTDATTYEPMPVLVADSPTGGVISDATPPVLAHMTGETLTKWRVRVLDTTFETLWDSELNTGAFSTEVPFRNPETKKRILKVDNATYLFDMRGWGNRDRATAVGEPSYARQLVTVVYNDSVGVTPPDSYTVAPVATGSPVLRHTWHRSTAADAWLIIRDGEIMERLDPTDVTVSAGVYTWDDAGLSRPYRSHDWKVRAVVSGVRSVPSNTVTYTSKPVGVWLVPVGVAIDPIACKGVISVDQFARHDRRATYQPPTTGRDVDIIYSQEGISGTFNGTISDTPANRHALTDVDRLEALAALPAAQVRLVWATESIPVILRDLTALPASTFDDTMRRHNVSFTFMQDGD